MVPANGATRNNFHACQIIVNCLRSLSISTCVVVSAWRHDRVNPCPMARQAYLDQRRDWIQLTLHDMNSSRMTIHQPVLGHTREHHDVGCCSCCRFLSCRLPTAQHLITAIGASLLCHKPVAVPSWSIVHALTLTFWSSLIRQYSTACRSTTTLLLVGLH